ncbi:MAG: hypothetical protein DMF03_01915 [Verrucomicrobia bacterium]|nr:MAG: hypothetical protein DMF03_01915 [Verrucomicrobiota bacterium]
MQRSVLCGLAVIAFCQPCFAGTRHFTYLYEAPTTPAGTFELENYVTARFAERGFGETDFRHELEFGITDRLQASIYFANWSDVQKGDNRGTHYDSASLETIYNFSNPAGDPIGISVYQELSAGRRVIESETKLIAQKNFGPLILAYNFTLEAEWDGEGLREHAGELQQVFGASYELAPRLSVGAETLYEIVLPDWKSAKSDHNFFVGPNFSYRGNRWFATVTGLAQVTDTASEPDYQIRLIFGVAL